MTDHEVIAAMEQFGGSFVIALARCFRYADEHNFSRLKSAFPECWDKYTEMARLYAEQVAKK